MGKRRVIAETGAGQHGVATATACARFGLDCVVYMGEEDIRRQKPNVFSMKLLGAEVRPVTSGSRTLRDAINEAMRDWMSSVETTHYILGSVVGPHPFPVIVRDFQSVIGRETIEQCARPARPAAEPGRGRGGRRQQRGRHVLSVRRRRRGSSCWASRPAAARTSRASTPRRSRIGSPGVLHGSYSYVMQDEDGQTCDVHSVSAGLDYPGVGPEHSYWKDTGRVRYTFCRDAEALAAFHTLARTEGILPALESSHAVAKAIEVAAHAAGRRRDRGLPLGPRRQGRGRNRPAHRGQDDPLSERNHVRASINSSSGFAARAKRR